MRQNNTHILGNFFVYQRANKETVSINGNDTESANLSSCDDCFREDFLVFK